MSILRDLRYGVRTLRKSPGLMIVATLALGFGIGLTATMWSIIYGAMIKGLPYAASERIVVVNRTNPSRGFDRMGVTVHDYYDYAAQQKSFEVLGGYSCGTMNVSGGGAEKPERFSGCWMTAGALQVPQVAPTRGRMIQPGEDRPGGERVAVISHAMWQGRYGGEDVIGRTIRVNAQPYTVVGVMPDRFEYPSNSRVWVPYQVDPLATKRGEGQQLTVVARLRPGISVDEANVDLNNIAQRIETDHKDTNEGIRATVMPFVDAFIGPEPTRLLYTMLGAVGFVLLIACANVANLLLDRAAHRTKEVGIRTALGASRTAVVRQFLAEALILATMGALLGVGIAQVGVTLFNRAIADSQPPFFIDIQLHPPVLLFIVGVTAVASLFAGMLPAIQSARADINEILKDESRGASSLHIGKMSRALVVFEIALSCGLLVAAGLMTKSVTKLRNIDPGFDTRNLFTARVGFPVGMTDSIKQRQFFEQLPERLLQIPGAQSAAVVSGLPGVNMGGRRIIPEGKTYERERDQPEVRTLNVTPGYFETFKVSVRQGRAFTDADRSESGAVAIVNQKFVDTHFRGVDPLGRRFRFPGGTDSLVWRTIVGVIPNVYSGDNEEPWPESVFIPFAQQPTSFASMAIRTAGAPMTITQQVRDAVASLDADLPIYFVYSMEEALARPTWFVRVFGTMFMIFGVIALFLAGIGLYAVMAFSVSRRTREVGIRMALGAKSGDVVRLIFGQGMVQLGIGLALGLALAAGVSRLLSIILFDVQPRDPVIFGGVVAVLATAGLLACFIPARRATGVDPLVALRSD
jgi:putative ABC transport system permease protein